MSLDFSHNQPTGGGASQDFQLARSLFERAFFDRGSFDQDCFDPAAKVGQDALTPLREHLGKFSQQPLYRNIILEDLARYVVDIVGAQPDLGVQDSTVKSALNVSVLCELSWQILDISARASSSLLLSASKLARKQGDVVGQINSLALICENETDLVVFNSICKHIDGLVEQNPSVIPAALPGCFRVLDAQIRWATPEIDASIKEICGRGCQLFFKNQTDCIQLLRSALQGVGGQTIDDLTPLRRFDSPLGIVIAMLSVATLAQIQQHWERAEALLEFVSDALNEVAVHGDQTVVTFVRGVVHHARTVNLLEHILAEGDPRDFGVQHEALIKKLKAHSSAALEGLNHSANVKYGASDLSEQLGFNTTEMFADVQFARCYLAEAFDNRTLKKMTALLQALSRVDGLVCEASMHGDWQFNSELREMVRRTKERRRIFFYGGGTSAENGGQNGSQNNSPGSAGPGQVWPQHRPPNNNFSEEDLDHDDGEEGPGDGSHDL